MKRTGIARSTKPLARRTPLRSKPSRRARPDEPLATWCEARLPGSCTGRATDRHHRLPRSAGGTDDPTNTIDICSADHAYLHAHPVWARSVGLLIPRGGHAAA